jgi:hypothetical protein
MDAATAMDPHLESLDKTVGGAMRVAIRGCVLLIGMIAIADDDFRFRDFDPLMIDSHGSYMQSISLLLARGVNINAIQS